MTLEKKELNAAKSTHAPHKRKKGIKEIIASLMSTALISTMMPMQALADVISPGSPDYNDAMIEPGIEATLDTPSSDTEGTGGGY